MTDKKEADDLKKSVEKFDRLTHKTMVWVLLAVIVVFAMSPVILFQREQSNVSAAVSAAPASVPAEPPVPMEKEVELSNGAVVLCLIIPTEHGQAVSCDWQRAVPPKKRPPKVL